MLLLCRAHTIPLLVCLVSSGGQKLQNEDGSYPDDIPKVTAEDAKRGVEEHYCGGKNCYDVIGMPRPDEPDPDEPAKTKKKEKIWWSDHGHWTCFDLGTGAGPEIPKIVEAMGPC